MTEYRIDLPGRFVAELRESAGAWVNPGAPASEGPDAVALVAAVEGAAVIRRGKGVSHRVVTDDIDVVRFIMEYADVWWTAEADNMPDSYYSTAEERFEVLGRIALFKKVYYRARDVIHAAMLAERESA